MRVLAYPMDPRALNMSGLSIRFAPPITAIPEEPDRRSLTAWCKATNEVEQPVSSVMLAPLRSKKWETRFDAIAAPVPVIMKRGKSSSSLTILSL